MVKTPPNELEQPEQIENGTEQQEQQPKPEQQQLVEESEPRAPSENGEGGSVNFPPV